ncbi:MAG: Ig-like domain-containing protein [Nostocoides sp.]
MPQSLSAARLGRVAHALGVLGLAGTVLLSACSGGATGDLATVGASGENSPTQTSTATPAEVSVTPTDKATDVLPNADVSVSASVGTIDTVSVKDAKGNALTGGLGSDGTWTATSRMTPDTSYTVTVTASGTDGTPATSTSTFSTLTPKTTATYGLNYAGMTVGVGMPVIVQFDSAVTDKAYRAEVEKNIDLTVTPEQPGSWGWLDNRQLMWRPKEYWKPGTVVKIKTRFTGLQTGPDKWVANDDSGGFTVGAATISYVNVATHQMKVTQNGKTVKTIPISAGRNEMPYITRSGTKVIIEKQPTVIMDAATSGIPKSDPNYYREKVDWDLRLTWTGEYIHSAPWSVYAQGNANVSHGCVNVGPDNAIWMYKFSKVGDIVQFTGSNRPFLPTEGIGVWQYSYANWQKQSALT